MGTRELAQKSAVFDIDLHTGSRTRRKTSQKSQFLTSAVLISAGGRARSREIAKQKTNRPRQSPQRVSFSIAKLAQAFVREFRGILANMFLSIVVR